MPDASLNIGNTRRLRWTDAGALAYRRGQHGGLSYFRAMASGDIPRLPMYSVMDMRLTDVEPGYCRFECDPGPHMLNPVGGVHGGIYAIFLDSAAGIAAQSRTDEGFATRTVRLNVDFLRPLTAGSGTIFCEGRTVKTGRQIIVSDAAMFDREGREFGRAQGTFMIVPIDSSAPPGGESPPLAERELLVEWGDPGATVRASADRTGFEVMTMIADGRLPEPPVARDARLRPPIRRRRRGDLRLQAGRAPVQPDGEHAWRYAGDPDRCRHRRRHPHATAGRLHFFDGLADLRIFPRHNGRYRAA